VRRKSHAPEVKEVEVEGGLSEEEEGGSSEKEGGEEGGEKGGLVNCL
jgi:hypothetical protein